MSAAADGIVIDLVSLLVTFYNISVKLEAVSQRTLSAVKGESNKKMLRDTFSFALCDSSTN